MLIRLRGCAGWSAPLLFAYGISHVFAWSGPDCSLVCNSYLSYGWILCERTTFYFQNNYSKYSSWPNFAQLNNKELTNCLLLENVWIVWFLHICFSFLVFLKESNQSHLFGSVIYSSKFYHCKLDQFICLVSGVWLKMSQALQNQLSDLCAQQRLGSAWAPTHLSDQSSLSAWKKPWVLSYPLSAQERLWSDWADAYTDESLCWANRSFCWVFSCCGWNIFILLFFNKFL